MVKFYEGVKLEYGIYLDGIGSERIKQTLAGGTAWISNERR